MSWDDLFDKALYRMINGKRQITEPIFAKEFREENEQLDSMIELSKKISNKEKLELIERDILFLKSGLEGESNVYYELKNSFLPFICLHDIRLENQNYVAQFDFIIITKNGIHVLETKKLNGDIEITSDGDFIRLFKNKGGKVYKKEGFYSPISQNERHVKILRDVLISNGLIKKMPIKSFVVMANPKTILNKTKCPKDIKNNIYKYDQVVNILKKEIENKDNDFDFKENFLYAIAEFLLKNNKPITYNLEAKYSIAPEDYIKFEDKESTSLIDKNAITDKLKSFRLEHSRKEKIKPYLIFNNAEMEELIEKMPKNKDELLTVKGFGSKKIEKYGDEILSILNER